VSLQDEEIKDLTARLEDPTSGREYGFDSDSRMSELNSQLKKLKEENLSLKNGFG
jgi:hypothetical protein